MVKILFYSILLSIFFGVAFSVGRAQQTNDALSKQPSAPAILIGPGDLIDVTIFDSPELSGRFRVDENGDIQLALLGSVHVQGLTAKQAASSIEKQYVTAQVIMPQSALATVFIEEYANQGISVTGEVKIPGVYPALGIRMLNDVIASAGGVTQLAASKVVITHRTDPQHPSIIDYNPESLKPVIPAVQILPGDSITVPRAGIVYVVGDVNKPGGFVLDGRNTLTVEEAMGLAGGGGRAAKLHQVELVRILPDGRKEMIAIPVDRIFEGKSPDVALNDQDILYVPTSTGKLVAEQIITSAISIGSEVAIYKTALNP